MNARRLVALFAFVAIVLFGRSASAHKPSDSYLTFDLSGAVIDTRWDIALRDLDYAIGLDGDGDGNVTWGEVRAREVEIDAYAQNSLDVWSDGGACIGRPAEHRIVEHSDGTYVVLQYRIVCPKVPSLLDVTYRLFFEGDPQHRGLLHLEAGGRTSALTFAADHRSQHLDLSDVSRTAQLAAIVKVGVHHIWEGYDHLLFLLALLLPSVLRREEGAWKPVPLFRPALWDVLRIVTAFTVAHSITLSLAALDVVRLPSRLTEAAIAASVIVAAANNVYPLLKDDRWLAAFALGLLHGFGFSATLVDLGLPRSSLVTTLLGFNVGVELGQLTVVAAFLPLAFVMRRTFTYRRIALIGGSVAIGILASVWLVERAFEVRILS